MPKNEESKPEANPATHLAASHGQSPGEPALCMWARLII
jgi:hypothetical protein